MSWNGFLEHISDMYCHCCMYAYLFFDSFFAPINIECKLDAEERGEKPIEV